QQGHLESALGIYNQLAAQRPGDPDIAARREALLRQMSGAAAPQVPEAVPPVAKPAPTPAPRAVAPPPAAPAPAYVEPPAAEAPIEEASPVGPTIREFLLALIAG